MIPSYTPSYNPSSLPSFLPSNSPSQCNGDYLDIHITFDEYANENSWTLQQDSVVIETFSAINYSTDLSNGEYVEQLCLKGGTQYTWTIFDSSKDGICCDDGNGKYELKLNGVVIASGSEFGDEAEHIFYSSSVPYSWYQVGSDINGDVKYDQSGISVSCSYDCSIIAVGKIGRASCRERVC